jgi:hypothetical protein
VLRLFLPTRGMPCADSAEVACLVFPDRPKPIIRELPVACSAFRSEQRLSTSPHRALRRESPFRWSAHYFGHFQAAFTLSTSSAQPPPSYRRQSVDWLQGREVECWTAERVARPDGQGDHRGGLLRL